MQAFRFVVVYRGEPATRKGDADVNWRGWVEQVFPDVSDDGARQFFQHPSELGGIIEHAIGHPHE